MSAPEFAAHYNEVNSNNFSHKCGAEFPTVLLARIF
jgi:hypothetical protein